jgi:hypothetical protein
MEPICLKSGESAPGDSLRERSRLLAAEPLELHLGESVERPQPHDQVVEDVVVIDLLSPGRRRHHEPSVRVDSEQVVEELHCLSVAPLEVVDHEQDRANRGKDCRRQSVQQPPPLVAGWERLGTREAGDFGEELRKEPRQLGQAPSVQRPDTRRHRL